MDGQPKMTVGLTRRDLFGLITMAYPLTWVISAGCSGTAGDEGTVNLIAAQEAESQNPALAKKAAKFSSSMGIAPGPKRPAR